MNFSGKKDSIHKPLGVLSFAVIFVALAVVSLMVSNVILTEMLPQQQYTYFALMNWSTFLAYITNLELFPEGIFLPTSFDDILTGFEFLNIMALSGIITAGVGALAGIGLITMKRRG